MSIRLLVKFKVKPGCSDKVIEALKNGADMLRQVPGCEAVEVLHSIEQPEIVLLSEIWESQQIHDEFAAKAPSGSESALAEFLVGDVTTETYNINY